MTDTARTTGSDPIEGADPGGTHSTRPGNPDKSGPSLPGRVGQAVTSGDRNSGRPDDASTEPGTHRDG